MTQPYDGFTCYWRIENVDLCILRAGCSFKSQLFQVPKLKYSIWHLELKSSLSNQLGLYLHKDGGLCGNTNIDYELGILTTSGWVIREKSLRTKFKENWSDGKGDILDWNDHILEKTYLLNGCLTVSCNMSNGASRDSYEQCVMTSRMISDNKLIHMSLIQFTSLMPDDLLNVPSFSVSHLCPSCVLREISEKSTPKYKKQRIEFNKEESSVFNDGENLIQLLKEDKFRYVILRTASKDFAVHKALLCARSPVFTAMFQGNMKESDSNIVDIDDIDSDTLFLLLRFLHLESIGDFDCDDAVKLYYAADKYQIPELKNECCLILTRKLSDKSICQTLILADRHQDGELRQNALEYFCKNSKTIFKSPEWTDLLFNKISFEISFAI